jgi:uncharacterized protein YggE
VTPRALAAPLVVLFACAALAQDKHPDTPDRLTVPARGTARAPATEVELELVVRGTAENASDAEKIHRERLAKVLAALEGKTKDDDAPPARKRKRPRPETSTPEDPALVAAAAALEVAVAEGPSTAGAEVTPDEQEYDENGNAKPREKSFDVATAVRVTVKGIDKASPAAVRLRLCELIDRATQAGADGGTGEEQSLRPAVRFRVTDSEALRSKAYADAMTRARARADEIARLAGRTARLVSITEETAPGGSRADKDLAGLEGILSRLGDRRDEAAPDGSSPTNIVTTEVELRVEFELRAQ